MHRAVIPLLTAAITIGTVLMSPALVDARPHDPPGNNGHHQQQQPPPQATPTPTSVQPAAATNTPAPTSTATAGLSSSTNTPVPTNTPTLPPPPTATSTPASSNNSGDGASGDSMFMHAWSPTGDFGTAQSSGMPYCTTAEHDAFYVVAPDGLRYPTWHPPVITRANGQKCTFGHEHGDDPRSTAEFVISQRRYAHNGDLAHAGIPFGYSSTLLSNWEAATGNSVPMRMEDHVGHKVAAAQNLGIGLDHGPNTPQYFLSGVTCNYIIQFHQGTHSRDAFENNLHEVQYLVDCTDGHYFHEDLMAKFGKAGEMTRSCQPQGDTSTFIQTGFSFSNPSYPGGELDGSRKIFDRSCVTNGFLVPPGSWSPAAYESWTLNAVGVFRADGSEVVGDMNLLFDIQNPARYYYPGQPDNLGHVIDACYETIQAGNLAARGGLCDISTNYGQWQGVPWNDSRSLWNGTIRGLYFKPGVLQNGGGPTMWYTDPFGGNASSTPFPGAVAQDVAQQNSNYSALGGGFESATNVESNHEDADQTVHAPN